MNGLHLTADLHGCDPAAPVMTDQHALRALCMQAVAAAGLQAVGECFHQFPELHAPAPAPAPAPVPVPVPVLAPMTKANPSNAPAATHRAPQGGVTGVVLLAESHLAVHTWPEQGAVTLDAYVCNLHQDNRDRADALFQHLLTAFAPAHISRRRLERGDLRASELPHAHATS